MKEKAFRNIRKEVLLSREEMIRRYGPEVFDREPRPKYTTQQAFEVIRGIDDLDELDDYQIIMDVCYSFERGVGKAGAIRDSLQGEYDAEMVRLFGERLINLSERMEELGDSFLEDYLFYDAV